MAEQEDPIEASLDLLMVEKVRLEESLKRVTIAIDSIKAVRVGAPLRPYASIGLQEAALAVVNSADVDWPIYKIIKALKAGGKEFMGDAKHNYTNVYTALRRLSTKGAIEMKKDGGKTVFRRRSPLLS